MTTDIVERLRIGFDWDESSSNQSCIFSYQDITEEAADEIERMRVEYNELLDFAIWMSGHDIWEHNRYFQEKRHLLSKSFYVVTT